MIMTICHCRGQRWLVFISWRLNKVGIEIFLYLTLNMHCCWVFGCCRKKLTLDCDGFDLFWRGWEDAEMVPNDRSSCCINLNERQPAPLSSAGTVGSCYPPGVPLGHLGGRQSMVMLRDGRRDARTSHGEEQLEAQEAPSHHSQLSHLHHSPDNTEAAVGWRDRNVTRGHTCNMPWKSLKKINKYNNNSEYANSIMLLSFY